MRPASRHSKKARSRSSRQWIIALQSAWVSMRPGEPRVSRHSSRFGKASVSGSALGCPHARLAVLHLHEDARLLQAQSVRRREDAHATLAANRHRGEHSPWAGHARGQRSQEKTIRRSHTAEQKRANERQWIRMLLLIRSRDATAFGSPSRCERVI